MHTLAILSSLAPAHKSQNPLSRTSAFPIPSASFSTPSWTLSAPLPRTFGQSRRIIQRWRFTLWAAELRTLYLIWAALTSDIAPFAPASARYGPASLVLVSPARLSGKVNTVLDPLANGPAFAVPVSGSWMTAMMENICLTVVKSCSYHSILVLHISAWLCEMGLQNIIASWSNLMSGKGYQHWISISLNNKLLRRYCIEFPHHDHSTRIYHIGINRSPDSVFPF